MLYNPCHSEIFSFSLIEQNNGPYAFTALELKLLKQFMVMNSEIFSLPSTTNNDALLLKLEECSQIFANKGFQKSPFQLQKASTHLAKQKYIVLQSMVSIYVN